MKKVLFPGVPALLILFFIYVYIQVFVPISRFPDKTFIINRNETGQQIFVHLQEQGFIKKVWAAKLISKVFSMSRFYPEEFTFDYPMSTYEIVKLITTRPPSLAVLIPEGFTKVQVADRLATTIKKFNKTEFLDKAEEGYLFPETYFFYSYATNDEILKSFSDNFYQKNFARFGRVPTDKEVIIASMLQREAKYPGDMKIISGIIQNRLKKDMPLQIDATVLYGKGVWKSKVNYSDLAHKSDFNTYKNKGLPPSPISNPGLDAIDAAMHPDKNNYLFYLTGNDGKMYYAETAEQHIKNKLKYIR